MDKKLRLNLYNGETVKWENDGKLFLDDFVSQLEAVCLEDVTILPRPEVKSVIHEVMDMYMDEGGWTENERHLLGELTVESALNTTDRRRVYAEDYSGDGTWWVR